MTDPCQHPSHANPALVIPCPDCSDQDPPDRPLEELLVAHVRDWLARVSPVLTGELVDLAEAIGKALAVLKGGDRG